MDVPLEAPPLPAAPVTVPGPDMELLRATALQDSSVVHAVAAAGLTCPVEWAFAVDDDAARFHRRADSGPVEIPKHRSLGFGNAPFHTLHLVGRIPILALPS